MEDVITISRDVHMARLCAMCCQHTMPMATGDDVEAVAQQLEQEPATYHATTLATVVLVASHTAEGYSAIHIWAIPTCGKFKVGHCLVVHKHMAELCSNAAFMDRHGVLLSADTGSDTLRDTGQ